MCGFNVSEREGLKGQESGSTRNSVLEGVEKEMSEEIEKRLQQAFVRLKPACVQAMEHRSWSYPRHDENNVFEKLRRDIEQLQDDQGVFVGLMDYILFPIFHMFKSTTASTASVESGLRCMLLVLTRCPPRTISIGTFRELLVCLPLLISHGRVIRTKSPPSLPSEELQLVATKCVLQLLKPDTVGLNRDLKVEKEPLVSMLKKREVADPAALLKQREYQPMVAHIIAVLLDVTENRKHLDLQLAALDAQQRLFDIVQDPDLLTQIVPGCVSAYSKVISRDRKQNHKLVVACLNTLSEIICRVFAEDVNPTLVRATAATWDDLQGMMARKARTDDSMVDEGLSQSPGTVAVMEMDTAVAEAPKNPNSKVPKFQVRDERWLASVLPRLHGVFRLVSTVRDHEHWKVRLALSKITTDIVVKCSALLLETVPILLETLILNLTDQFEQVRKYSLESIHRVSSIFETRIDIHQLLGSSFQSLLGSLPRLLMQADDRKKLETLRLCNGYVILLREHISTILSASLDQCSIGLLKILTFDTSDVKIVEDRLLVGQYGHLTGSGQAPINESGGGATSSGNALGERTRMFPRRYFRYFHEDAVVEAIAHFCRLLGHFGNVPHLFDHFLNFISSEEGPRMFQSQAIWVLNEMSLGMAGIGISQYVSDVAGGFKMLRPKEKNSAVRMMVQEYLRLDILEYPTGHADEQLLLQLRNKFEDVHFEEEHRGVSSYNHNILTISLVLEGIGNAVIVLDRDFDMLLIDVLYPLLEKLGGANKVVSDSAMTTLRVIARVCGKGSTDQDVGSLVLSNVDYVVNTAALKFRYITLNPRSPQVLQAAISVAGVEIVKYMDDVLEDVLQAIDDQYMDHPALVPLLIRVLCALVEVLDKPNEARTTAEVNRGESAAIEGKSLDHQSFEQKVPFLADCSVEMRDFFLKIKAEEKEAEEIDERLSSENRTIDDVGKFFTDRDKKKKEEEEGGADGMDDVPDVGDPTSASTSSAGPDHPRDEVPKPTQAESLALKILTKCQHFLGTDDPILRSIVLRLVRACIPVLSTRPTDLNPSVHLLWPIIVRRLADSKHFVALEAAELIVVLARHVRDFVSKRIVDDVWPRFELLARQMQGEHNHVRRQEESDTNNQSSTHSVQFKLQASMLECVASLLRDVPMRVEDVRGIGNVVWPFLNERVYPVEVQDRAMEVMRTLVGVDPDGTLHHAACIIFECL
ncbi:TEL2-interacting protein 1 [Quaeritorhiza haematococci]|nr:TEL2-interacting protein 1 [Quaeritorhiza haematococci]